jgi:two-component system, NtrC family, sensor histidine kinase GlrK
LLSFYVRIKYPNSFIKLLLYGFAIAILPIVVAFIYANWAFIKLSHQTQIEIDHAVYATRAGMALQQNLNLVERSAKQYYVLGDTDLFTNYKEARSQFAVAINSLRVTTSNQALQTALSGLEQQESAVFTFISQVKKDKPKASIALKAFDQMHQLTQEIINNNNALIDANSNQLMANSRQAQKRFFMLSIILIPIMMVVAFGIAYLLGRPIRKMESAITNLGKGEYQDKISIDGPGNLRILGQRLDWLRQELLDLKLQKQQFLQHISHELKTPLTAIREATELLTDGVGGQLTPQQQEITNILKENSIRLQKMIENLLNFTKIEADKITINREIVTLGTLLDAIVQSHVLTIKNKNITVNKQLESPEISADPDKLMVVIDNLMSNAIKFSPKHGTINITYKRSKHTQIIEVIDNGPGLSEQDKSQLFDPFYQGKTLHQGLIKSSGLGLAVAKDLIEAHHGTIELSDTKLGAHFIVKIPQ